MAPYRRRPDLRLLIALFARWKGLEFETYRWNATRPRHQPEASRFLSSCAAPRSLSPGFINKRCSQRESQVAQLLIAKDRRRLFAALFAVPADRHSQFLLRAQEKWPISRSWSQWFTPGDLRQVCPCQSMGARIKSTVAIHRSIASASLRNVITRCCSRAS